MCVFLCEGLRFVLIVLLLGVNMGSVGIELLIGGVVGLMIFCFWFLIIGGGLILVLLCGVGLLDEVCCFEGVVLGGLSLVGKGCNVGGELLMILVVFVLVWFVVLFFSCGGGVVFF